MVAGSRLYRLVSGTRHYPLLPGEWLLGRSPGAGIAVADALASREHAAVRVGPAGVEVEDLGSRNGTFVNDARLGAHTPVALRAGDLVRLGDTVFVLEEDALPAAGAEGVWEEPAEPVKVARKRGKKPPPELGESTVVPPAGPRPVVYQGRGGSPEETSAIIDPRTALLVLDDNDWADQIRRAAAIHPNLTIQVATPAKTLAALGHILRGVLLLDVDAAAAESERILRAWTMPLHRGPVILAAEKPEHEGAVLARQLKASGYVKRGKSAILVVAQIRYHLQRADFAPAGP
ncbi:MAG TPA: FHA domain-containing protein [Myxococcota bacterium]|jgi:hypothetical protein|nr:FHA domain-containing protein [Myxococcota bacterium]